MGFVCQALVDCSHESDCTINDVLVAHWSRGNCHSLCHGVLQRQKEIVKISVGAQAINELLGGGIESRCITEIYGEFR